MVDNLTEEARSEHMSRICGRDTQPELTVRRLIHRMGYRYRLHRRDQINQARLRKLGWEVLVVWECETTHTYRACEEHRSWLSGRPPIF